MVLTQLQDNTFTASASKTLSTVLPKWPALLDLGVGDCLLGARGGRHLGEALAQGTNTKIEVLRLQYNEIDSTGVKAICDAATSSKAMPRLRRVELNGNKFSEEDSNVEKMREMLAGRKESAGQEYPGVDEDDEEAWGLDELDELDDEDEDDEEDEDGEDVEKEEGDELDGKEEKVLKEADEAEQEPVSQKKDPDVDELADALGKTELK